MSSRQDDFKYPRAFLDPTDAFNARALENHLRQLAWDTIEVSLRSENWDGGDDLSGGKDGTATQGFFLDVASGSIQAMSLFADSGSLDNLVITGGTITAPLFQTATSGERLEIDGPSGDSFIKLFDASGVTGYMGWNPTGWGADDLVISTVGNSDGILVDAHGGLLLKAGGVSGVGVTIKSGAAGGSPGTILRVQDGAGSTKFEVLTTGVAYAAYNGAAATPAFDVNGQGGLYSYGTGKIALTAGGAWKMAFDTYFIYSSVPIQAPAGSSAAPSFAISTDTNTGLYSYASNVLAVSAGGSPVFLWGQTEVVPMVPVRINTSGTVGAPAYSYNTDKDTGFYRLTANYHGSAAGGVIIQQWGYTGTNKEVYLYGLPAAATNYVRYNGATGQLSYSSSTLRIKKDIRPLEVGLTDKMRPSRFRYRRDDEIEEVPESDSEHQSSQFRVAEEDWDTENIGMIAEWTADIDPSFGIFNPGDDDAVNYQVEAILAAVVRDLQDTRRRLALVEQGRE